MGLYGIEYAQPIAFADSLRHVKPEVELRFIASAAGDFAVRDGEVIMVGDASPLLEEAITQDISYVLQPALTYPLPGIYL